MKHSALILSAAACALLASDPVGIERIVVSGSADDGSSMILDSNRTGNVQTFGTKSIATLGTQANMNPYTIIQYSPSVNFTPVDAAGSNEPSYHDPIRIRGKSQSGPGGVFMIDGTPISSNPGGGKQLVDMENVASIDLHKGYLSADKNLGFSSLIGKVDMNLRQASSKAGAEVSQAFGSDSFMRTFVRFDSGRIGDVAMFGSFSRLGSEKTKGEGDLERINGTLGLTYTPSDAFKAKITAIRNSDEHHNYYNMSYAEASNLGSNFDKEFATTRPSANNDVDYYDWNRQDFLTTAVLGEIEYRPSGSDRITFKPYYKKDEGSYWYSNANASDPTKNRVVNWRIDHDLYGATAAYEHTFSEALKAKIGYWYHKQLPPGPPSDQVKYRVVNGNLVYDGYAVLADNDYHVLQAPYTQLSGTIDRLTYVAGLQYQSFRLGALKSHTNGNQTGSANPDYDAAIATTAVDPWASVDAKTFHTLIPSLYLGYEFTPSTTLYASYSRTYGFDVNLFPSYVSNRANFVAKNVTLQQLWDTLDLELSDNIDVGVKTTVGGITFNPGVFVSFVQNKQANIYDPAYGVNYPANVGDALGYGAEFSAYGPISESLEFIASLSYNRYAFTQNFQSGATTSVETDGKQLPDAPKVMAKAALSYTLGDWTLTPSVRYTSSRWGDVQNTQKIDAFTLVDFDAQYRLKSFMGSRNAVLRLSATNLLDEEYISTINAADNFLAATGTATTYQTGAPLAIFGSLNLKF
ncbi:MAG: TonB-dependent receptor [Sulfuricurvum sp.]|jgi:iron complex outermembrane receptor protein|nr:TonB-dependent receptor [Sulfuricurvum sp.]MDX9967040.1 TonB-dependent receptor [Sulfuricurvum sp.]